VAGRPKQVYPNTLKQARLNAMLSQPQLVALCRQTAEQDPLRYKPISIASVRSLEAGERRPRRNLAATLARVLEVDPHALFPAGFDDQTHNPLGRSAKAPNPEE
jgi:hypothetical protein